jgi:hypothetical protein
MSEIRFESIPISQKVKTPFVQCPADKKRISDWAGHFDTKQTLTDISSYGTSISLNEPYFLNLFTQE